MAKIYEELSKASVNSAGKPDSNLSNDSNNLGGVPAEEYATKKYVQDYHNTKEASQKNYIDQQDQAMLEAAKEYTNSQIRNQDFSNFAELKDVQALDDKFTENLANCQQECADNLKTRTDEIVKDVNANFDDVNKAIENLNKGQNDLFQSVSDGKAKVAEAITDKGVTTSATDSFDTMAGNIRNIKTGGGELDPNFVNTSDGTATESDIKLGKTAYVKGQKVYGSHTCPSLWDATATPDKIVSGYTAYNGSGKITGTMDMQATATPYDILQGKTAWVNGQKIEGILSLTGGGEGGNQPSYNIGDVEKIYGQVTGDIVYSQEQISKKNSSTRHMILANSGQEPVALFHLYKPSSWTEEDNSSTLEIYMIDKNKNNELEYFNRKEIGETEFNNIFGTNLEINCKISVIQASDFSDEENRYIHFVYYEDNKYKLYIAKIKITKEEVDSGKYIEYFDIDTDKIWETDLKRTYSTLILSQDNRHGVLLNSGGTMCIYERTDVLDESTGKYKINIKTEGSMFSSISASVNDMYCSNIGDCRFLNNEKLIYYTSNATTSELIVLDEHFNIVGKKRIENMGKVAISSDGRYGISGSTIYGIDIDYETGNINIREIKKHSSPVLSALNFINDANNMLISVGFKPIGSGGLNNKNQLAITYFKIDWENDEPLSLLGCFNETSINVYSHLEYGNGYQTKTTTDLSTIYFVSGGASSDTAISTIAILEQAKDYSQVVALKYQGEFFYRQAPKTLTAKQSDVRAEKMFIGASGYPEIGTMEV